MLRSGNGLFLDGFRMPPIALAAAESARFPLPMDLYYAVKSSHSHRVSRKAGMAKRVETQWTGSGRAESCHWGGWRESKFPQYLSCPFFSFSGKFFSTPWHVLALTSTAQHEEPFTLAVKLRMGEFSVALVGCQQGIYELIRVLR